MFVKNFHVFFKVGGFKLPFLAVGVTALVSSLPIYFILPKDDTSGFIIHQCSLINFF